MQLGEDAVTQSRYLLVFRLNGSKLVLRQSDNKICNSTEKKNNMRRWLFVFCPISIAVNTFQHRGTSYNPADCTGMSLYSHSTQSGKDTFTE